MTVSELLKQLTDHLAEHGDDDILVAVKPELEAPAQAFAVEHAIEEDGEQLALLSVPPSALLLPPEDKSCRNTCSDEVEEKEKADEPAKSLSESSESSQSDVDEITSILNRFTASLKEGDGPDPEKKAPEEPVSDLGRILKEFTSSGPASIQIRVTI